MQEKNESPLPFEQEFQATQSKICNFFLVLNALLLVAGIAAGLFRVSDIGWQPGLEPQYILVVFAFILAIFRNKLSYKVRATSIVVTLFLIGLNGMWASGFVAEGAALMLLVPVLVAIFFDTRTAVYAVGFIFVASALIGTHIVVTGRTPPFDLEAFVTSPMIWTFALVARAAVALALVLTVGAVTQSLLKSLAKAQSDREALAKSEERFALAMHGANDGLWDLNLASREAYYSPGWYSMFGYEPDDLPHAFDTWQKLIEPTDGERILELATDCIDGKTDSFSTEVRMLHKDGTWRDILSRAFTVREGGVATRIIGTHVDITEQRKLETKARHVQKMEAVSQLTGGVAHDFNNLLAVIMGNAELLREVLEQKNIPNTEDDLIVAILKAAGHGAELTQRLLAFSRQQPLRPREVDTIKMLANVESFLKRTLDTSIEVEVFISPGIWHARADAVQLENAILNLAFNGRDAMPEGGSLRINANNEHVEEVDLLELPGLEAGEYLVVSVTDSGSGMSAAVRGQAFEPFFTTKEIGKGSGLGLSMVYGFARQSGGSVSLVSSEKTGTIVKIYLPCARVAVASHAAEKVVKHQPGGETILLLEDDTSVLKLVVKTLKSLGYKVIEAATAAEAQAHLDGGMAVDLILSDIILPGGKSGPDFVEQVRQKIPEMKVIFMSGYSIEATEDNGLLSGETQLLNKPFRRDQLVDALDQAFSA